MDEIARFLHEHPPFSLLELDQLQPLTEKIQIEYFPANHDVLLNSGPPADYLYIIRRGSVDLLRVEEEKTHVFDTLGEGEFFGHLSLIRRQPPLLTVRTREETLAYLLPERVFRSLRRTNPAFAQFFPDSMIKRLANALQSHDDRAAPELFRFRMGSLIRYAVTVGPETSVSQAAQMMSQDDVSCVVVNSSPPGIVSDRDLRNRVVADRLDYDTPVKDVMSTSTVILPADSLVFEGLMLMVERNIHHIPVTENGQIVGVVTHTDILRQQSNSPLLLPRLLEQARTTEELQQYTAQVDTAAISLLDAGARARDVGRMVAIAYDALIRSLLHAAEETLGPPPCAYAWLALGSEGRYEQTVRTDQDNALVYADGAPEGADSYFAALAQHVIDHLIASGFPPCPGDIMATNPMWRQPLHVWKGYFDRWITIPQDDTLLRSAIFFDFRKIHGSLNIEAAFRPLIEQARNNRIFLGRLARAALRNAPPLGLFKGFRVQREGDSRDLIDLKVRGTTLIVDLARVYALEAGTAETSTLARLRAAGGSSSLDRSSAEELRAAFELIHFFRIRHQYQLIQVGEQPTNLVPISELTRLEQRDLKEALRAVSTSQRSLESTFQTSLFG